MDLMCFTDGKEVRSPRKGGEDGRRRDKQEIKDEWDKREEKEED